jgi:hypothetical protein
VNERLKALDCCLRKGCCIQMLVRFCYFSIGCVQYAAVQLRVVVER